ncbi:hypothetical protein ISF6_1823 [Piscinibacter sakaiensis]|uniref:PilZ domain-containing protein n=1 Tax=Piscinibacter sakaiensis TaxID=1547922 RepID=A0A0K8P029_PISS1|nr:hypothetical protein ISF6_1823 [Piscinibacter sakaiensis]
MIDFGDGGGGGGAGDAPAGGLPPEFAAPSAQLRREAANRRAHERYPLRIDVLLIRPDGARAFGRTTDLGRGGMGVVYASPIPVGTVVAVRAPLPGRRSPKEFFGTDARVVNCSLSGADGGFRIGLAFEALDAHASEQLARAFIR